MEEWLADVRCDELLKKLESFGVETPRELLLLDPEDMEELLRDLKRIPKKKFCLALQALESEVAESPLQARRAEAAPNAAVSAASEALPEALLLPSAPEASEAQAEAEPEVHVLPYEAMLASESISPVHRATLEKMAQRRKQREAKQEAARAAALEASLALAHHAAVASDAARLVRLEQPLQALPQCPGLPSSDLDEGLGSSTDDEDFQDVQEREPEAEKVQPQPGPAPQPQPQPQPEPRTQPQAQLEPEPEPRAAPSPSHSALEDGSPDEEEDDEMFASFASKFHQQLKQASPDTTPDKGTALQPEPEPEPEPELEREELEKLKPEPEPERGPSSPPSVGSGSDGSPITRRRERWPGSPSSVGSGGSDVSPTTRRRRLRGWAGAI